MGIAYYISVVQLVDTASLLASPPQWPLIFAGGIAGLIGSVVDSLLGATLQYSGIHTLFLRIIFLKLDERALSAHFWSIFEHL